MITAQFQGQTFEFPDEASDEDIDSAMNEWAAEALPQYDDANDSAQWLSSLDSYMERNTADSKQPRNGFDYNSYVDELGELEGVKAHTAFESGNKVRGYGVEIIPSGVVDRGDSRQLAYDTAVWHGRAAAKELNKTVGIDFSTLPQSVQKLVVDLHYNTGKSYQSVNESIASGDYLRAAANSLSIVGATVKGEKATVGGLARRRAVQFNAVADELGAERVSQVRVVDLGEQGTQYTYEGDSGGVIASFVTPRKLRSTDTDANGERVFTL